MLFESGPTSLEVVVNDPSSTTVLLKSEAVETCNRYVAAPEEAFHVNVKLVAWFEAPFTGETREGLAGGDGRLAAVVKLHEDE